MISLHVLLQYYRSHKTPIAKFADMGLLARVDILVLSEVGRQAELPKALVTLKGLLPGV